MKKLNNSDFDLLENIIKEIDFKPDFDEISKREAVEKCWIETAGDKISEYTRVEKITEDNILYITCADSFVSNELYLTKSKLIEILGKKCEKSGIKIKDIKFDYKKWKNKNEK